MKTYKNRTGKIVGKFEDGVYSKNVQRSKHLMRMYNGWGIDTAILTELESEECVSIQVYDSENQVTYRVPFAIFRDNGIKANFETPQTFLPLHFWSSSNQKKLLE